LLLSRHLGRLFEQRALQITGHLRPRNVCCKLRHTSTVPESAICSMDWYQAKTRGAGVQRPGSLYAE
jgi:hypothetical protein